MNLSDLRAAVYSQVDLQEDDLPTTLVDLYLQEGFQRTVQREQRWPSYETAWAVTTDSLTPAVGDFPSDIAGLVEVLDSDYRPLAHLGHSQARASFRDSTGEARYFSVWAQQVYLWPAPTAAATFELRGWRLPTVFNVSDPAGTIPDCDTRLHLPLVHYACSRVMAQQEDEILENTYLDSWNRGVEMARADIMRPMHDEPLILNIGLRLPVPQAGNRTMWNI